VRYEQGSSWKSHILRAAAHLGPRGLFFIGGAPMAPINNSVLWGRLNGGKKNEASGDPQPLNASLAEL